jgi:hypothetical protein
MQTLELSSCPEDMGVCLCALWYDATGDWDAAHQLVQDSNDKMAARIHAYLHRKEGDEWNSKYWHRRAGSVFPENMSLQEEWETLVRGIVS